MKVMGKKVLQSDQLQAHAGVTLVELLVVVALFGGLSIALATMMADFSTRNQRHFRHAQISQEIFEFSEAMEVYLTNTVRVTNCRCGGKCVFPAAPMGCATPPCTTDLLEFEIEDSSNPGQVAATAPCLDPGQRSSPATVDGLLPRGCKRSLLLRYLESDPTNPALGLGTLGALAIVDPLQGAVLHKLEGILNLNCGMTPTDATICPASDTEDANCRPSGTDFRLEIEVLVLGQVYREVSTTVPFHNITVRGVHFGKTQSALNCKKNGLVTTDGNCCSGYVNSTGTCIAADQCVVAGGNVSGAFGWTECCSHKWDGTNCT